MKVDSDELDECLLYKVNERDDGEGSQDLATRALPVFDVGIVDVALMGITSHERDKCYEGDKGPCNEGDGDFESSYNRCILGRSCRDEADKMFEEERKDFGHDFGDP